MIPTFALVLVCIAGAILLWSLWMLFCNSVTYRQRISLIDATRAYHGDEFWALMGDIDAVSYDQHLWRLATLRNPMKLYRARLVQAQGAANA